MGRQCLGLLLISGLQAISDTTDVDRRIWQACDSRTPSDETIQSVPSATGYRQ